MKDYKLEQRKEAFQKNMTNILETRQGYKLSLRKERIDDFIMKKREKALEKNEERSKFEINPENLILPPEIRNKSFSSLEEFITFVKSLLSSTDINYVKFGILLIRKQLSLEGNPPFVEIINAGMMPILLDSLDIYISHDTIVYEILWCFTNLTAGKLETEACNFFLTPKAYRIFDRILKLGKIELVTSLIWLVTHIGSDNLHSREAILNSNIFEQILELLEKDTVNISILKYGIWFISSLSKGGDVEDINLLERILKILCIYIRFNDQEVVGDSIWGLSNYSNTRFTSLMKLMIDMGVIPIILNYENSTNISLTEAPLRLIGNILTGDDQTIDEMLKYGVIQFLEKYLNSKYATLRREATWCFSNIAAGTKSQINTLITSGVMHKIYELVKDNTNDVVREAIWTVSNCLTGSDLDMCIKLANQGVLQPIIFVLVHNSEPSILGITLEGLRRFFEHGEVIKQFGNGNNPFAEAFIAEGGIDYLEKLQYHKNSEIYSNAGEILETFFNCQVSPNN